MKILCLNGGGTSGVFQNAFLGYLENATKKPICQTFDLIYGVSVGSIIGGAYARGADTRVVGVQLLEGSREIFRDPDSRMPWKSRYSKDKLRSFIKQFFGNMELDDLGGTKYAGIASLISGPRIRPEIWKSWVSENDHVRMEDICLASAAAPTFFDSHTFNGNTYVDGGMIVNNPTMCAIADALRMGEVIGNMYVLNLQTGIQEGFEDAHKKKGIIGWARDIYKLGLYGGDRMVEYQAHELLGWRNHAVVPPLNLSVDSLDFKTMQDMAKVQWDIHKDALLANLQ